MKFTLRPNNGREPVQETNWEFNTSTNVGDWDCPSCGKRGSIYSPDTESLHESATRAGLLWIGEGPHPLTPWSFATGRNSGFSGFYLCAACTADPAVQQHVAVLRVAEALKP